MVIVLDDNKTWSVWRYFLQTCNCAILLLNIGLK